MSQSPQPKAPRRAATTGHAALAELTPQGLGRAELLLRRAGAVELGQDSLRLLPPGHATAEALASDLLRAGALPSAELLGALQAATPHNSPSCTNTAYRPWNAAGAHNRAFRSLPPLRRRRSSAHLSTTSAASQRLLVSVPKIPNTAPCATR